MAQQIEMKKRNTQLDHYLNLARNSIHIFRKTETDFSIPTEKKTNYTHFSVRLK